MLTNFLIPFSWQCVPGYSCNRTVSILLSVLIFFDGVNSLSKPLLCLSLSPAYCLLVSLSLVFPLFFRTLSCLLQRRRGYRIRWRLSKLPSRTMKPVTRSFAEFAVDLEWLKVRRFSDYIFKKIIIITIFILIFLRRCMSTASADVILIRAYMVSFYLYL